MENLIYDDFSSTLGFDKDGEHYSIHHRIEVYLPSKIRQKIHVNEENKPKNYVTHIVRCKTEAELMPLFKLIGIE